MQRAALEIVLLAVPAGILGSWIVLRRLAFFAHAAGTATFPGLVVAGPWGIPAQLAALGSALGFAGATEALARRRAVDRDAATGLGLVAALALGAILASDVYRSGSGVDRLLFGTLIGIGDRDLVLAAGLAVTTLVADAALGRRWLVQGFDAGSARALGLAGRGADLALLVLVAAAVVVAVAAVGALLVTAVFVVPAATVRLLEPSLRALRVGAGALAASEGLAALVVARELDVGPGAAFATVAGAVFAAVLAYSRVRS